jgi:hypothetical protein
MAKKPETTSTLPHDESIIGKGMDRAAQPNWPRASDNAPDDSTLPVPDPSAFEPDTLPSEDTAASNGRLSRTSRHRPRPGTRHRKSPHGTWHAAWRALYTYLHYLRKTGDRKRVRTRSGPDLDDAIYGRQLEP